MKFPREISGVTTFEIIEYILKCFVGVAIGYCLYKAFPEYAGQFLWMLLSIILSITHDNNSTVAYDRMKGNIVGSSVGLFTFFLHNPANLLTIFVGIAMTIALCFRLRLITVSRTALVAFIIVVLYQETHTTWQGPVYRMASVVAGCLIGLIINHAFRRAILAFHRPEATTVVQRSESDGRVDAGE